MRASLRSTFGLASAVSGLLVLATLMIGFAAYELTHEAIEQQLDHRTATETRALLSEPGRDRIAAIARAIRRRETVANLDHIGYILVDGAGRRVAGSLRGAIPAKLGYEEYFHQADGRVAQSLTTALPGGGRLLVAADRALLDATDRSLWRLFAIACGTLLVVGVGGAWTVGAVTRGRLNRIDRAALAIIGGDLKQRMPIDGSGSEFDRVSATLNRMLDRIGALMDNLRQVSSDVAHDLRTPLTRLSNRLDEAQASDDPGVRTTAIGAAAEQARELLDIFAALLRISEIEAMGVRRTFRPVALSEAVAGLVDTYRPDIELSERHLVEAIAPAVVLSGDRRLLQQLASNLLDNALRHTPPGTTIRVTLAQRPGAVVLSVADDGAGVDVDQPERLFERFARTEHSRGSDGHGLGLALVQAIAVAHHGVARIVPEPGFTVEVTFDA